VLLGLLPAVSVARGARRRFLRARRGLCLRCGYDLRGLPDPVRITYWKYIRRPFDDCFARLGRRAALFAAIGGCYGATALLGYLLAQSYVAELPSLATRGWVTLLVAPAVFAGFDRPPMVFIANSGLCALIAVLAFVGVTCTVAYRRALRAARIVGSSDGPNGRAQIVCPECEAACVGSHA